MKKPRETAGRWFRQAEHDLQMARRLKEESPADSCYFAEQAAQKILKAFLFFHGSRGEFEHSIVFLAERCAQSDPSFGLFVSMGYVLDQYYIPTRYPDALADPAVPFESYGIHQAEEAIQMASEMVEKVRLVLGSFESP